MSSNPSSTYYVTTGKSFIVLKPVSSPAIRGNNYPPTSDNCYEDQMRKPTEVVTLTRGLYKLTNIRPFSSRNDLHRNNILHLPEFCHTSQQSI